MIRLRFLIILSFTLLVLSISTTFATGKEKKPVLERFEATMSPPLASDNSLSVTIQEFSSEDEVRGFAETYLQGGEGALEKAFSKVKKGSFNMGGGQTMPVVVITSTPEAPIRKLSILGIAPSYFTGQSGGSVTIGHRGYPYTYMQIEVDEQGKGKGVLVPFANVVFDQQGRTVIKSMGGGALQLVEVRRGK